MSERARLLRLCAEGDEAALEALRRLNERQGLDERYKTFCGPLTSYMHHIYDDHAETRGLIAEHGEEGALGVLNERLIRAFDERAERWRRDKAATRTFTTALRNHRREQSFLDTKREPWRKRRR